MAYYIKEGNLYVTDNLGGFVGKRITTNVREASYDDGNKTFVVTRTNGLVEIVNMNGLVLSRVHTEGVDAYFEGANVIVRDKGGKTFLVQRNGFVIRRV